MLATPRNIVVAGSFTRNTTRKPTLSELKGSCRISYELNAGFSLTPGDLLFDVKKKVSVVEGIQPSDLDTTEREHRGGGGGGGGDGGDWHFIGLKGCGLVIAGYYLEKLPHYVTANVSALGKSRTGTASAGRWAVVVTYYVPLIAYNNVSYSYGKSSYPICCNYNPHSLEEILMITESSNPHETVASQTSTRHVLHIHHRFGINPIRTDRIVVD